MSDSGLQAECMKLIQQYIEAMVSYSILISATIYIRSHRGGYPSHHRRRGCQDCDHPFVSKTCLAQPARTFVMFLMVLVHGRCQNQVSSAKNGTVIRALSKHALTDWSCLCMLGVVQRFDREQSKHTYTHIMWCLVSMRFWLLQSHPDRT